MGSQKPVDPDALAEAMFWIIFASTALFAGVFAVLFLRF